MRARTAVLSVLFSILFVFTANAQQVFRPNYTQKSLTSIRTAPVFVENRTEGNLEVVFDVNDGVLIPVKVEHGYEVPDLYLPVYSKVEVKEARTMVLEKGKRVWKKVKFRAYWRQNSDGNIQQGWMFYLNGHSLRSY